MRRGRRPAACCNRTPEFAAARALQRGELVQVLADWELEAQAYRLGVAALSGELFLTAKGTRADRLPGRTAERRGRHKH
jgi:hypothetical protein